MEKEKVELVQKVTELCVKILIQLMAEVEIPNSIETVFLDVKDNQKYKLRIEKITKKSLMQRDT